jgi:ferredoxin
MPRLITLSRAARLVGVKRGALQKKIQQGELRTFEGELLLADLLQVYPQTRVEDTTMLERVEHIMEQAVNKIVRPDDEAPDSSTLAARILALGQELAHTRQDARRYRNLVEQLQQKFIELETAGDDAQAFNTLKDWFKQASAAAQPPDETSEIIAKEAFLRVMAAQVRILPSGHEFFIEGSDSILEAGLRSGLALDYGCSSGNCGHCKAKVVSGQDEKTLEIVAAVYGSVVTAGIHKAQSIRVAEAAKVIENTQRDLNIAFMNELSAICHELGIDTQHVLAAAGTKWNFLPFSPGLVGGHCIGVDPYYLAFRAERAGYHPEIIQSGRRINDRVGQRIARECIRRTLKNGTAMRKVTVLGLTFKENVPDLRNSKVVDIINELSAFGVEVQVHDPLADAQEAMHEFGVTLAEREALSPADAVILAVPHAAYKAEGWGVIDGLLKNGTGLVMDIRACLDGSAVPDGIELWRL